MSHKKANSRIHVPFSWEKMPGVPKFMASQSPKCPLVPGLTGNNRDQVQRKTALPLPPGSFRQPVRSASKRMLLWEEDPFLAAIIECTKDCDNYKAKGESETKKSFGMISKSFLSSCKHSFDIKEGTLLMRPSRLGCIVRPDRVRSGLDSGTHEGMELI